MVRIADRTIVGAEALLRWNDPEHGDVPPQVFIPLAEESGLIHALGEWVLQTAADAMRRVAQRRACRSRSRSTCPARQFYREDLAQRISEIVARRGCEPSWIELEVTETSLLHDLDAIRKVLHQLRDEGFTVAIDDFGTGYSSLTHLKHFPIDTLKIDISFIADLETDPGDAAITEAIIGARARARACSVVAEGVGTRDAARIPRRARLPLLSGLLGQRGSACQTEFVECTKTRHQPRLARPACARYRRSTASAEPRRTRALTRSFSASSARAERSL